MSPAPVIIAIDGRSGSGKTTLAIELAARLREHHKVSLFHLEDIYPGWNGLAAGIERYVTTVLRPVAARRERRMGQLGLGRGTTTARPAPPARPKSSWWRASAPPRRPPAPAGRGDLGGLLRTRTAGARALARDGDTYEPFWDQWAAQEAGVAGGRRRPGPRRCAACSTWRTAPPRTTSCRPFSTFPPLAPALLPELAARRGLQLRAERIDARPEARPGCSRRSSAVHANAVWLDSSLDPAGLAPEAAERSRFSILADDGGRFGQVGPAQFRTRPA